MTARRISFDEAVMTTASQVNYDERRRLLERSQDADRPLVTEVDGLAFDIDLGVFSPAIFESTSAFASMIDVTPGECWLEIGSGCGAISVVLAKRGAAHVVATDITRAAVANTQANANKYSVADRITPVLSDVYDGLDASLRFHAIFWNTPWMVAPAGAPVESELELSIRDPNYDGIRRCLEQAERWLEPSGRVLLGFASFGDEKRLGALAKAADLRCTDRRTRRAAARADVEYVLYEFRTAT